LTARIVTRATDIPPDWVLVLDEIDEGISECSFQIGAAEVGIEDDQLRFDAPIDVSMTIGHTLQTFTLKAKVHGELLGDCGRCLAPTTASFDTKFRLFIQRKEAGPEELKAIEDEDEILIVDPGVREVTLVDALRDAVALDMPLRIHCREDCKGLCGQCGADLNHGACDCAENEVDPRWAALSQLKQGT